MPLSVASHEREGVDDGEKLPDIVCGSLHRAEMEHAASCGEVDALIFHHARIAEA